MVCLTQLKANYYGNELNLSNKDLTSLEGLQDIPANVLDQVIILDLSLNKFQELPAHIFSGLHNLKWLFLHNNRLKTLPSGVFSQLHTLEDLDLDKNQLHTLQADIFSGLHNLQNLSLGGNPFRADFLLSLPSIIRSVPTLKYLDYRCIEEALQLKDYRVYNPKTLTGLKLEYLMQNLTSEQMEELTEANNPAFCMLTLSDDEKRAIVNN